MDKHDDREQRMKLGKLFAAARRVDRETAPDWNDLLRKDLKGRQRRRAGFPLPLRVATFTLATAATVVALFAATAYMGVDQRRAVAPAGEDAVLIVQKPAAKNEEAPLPDLEAPVATPAGRESVVVEESVDRVDANAATKSDTEPPAPQPAAAIPPPRRPPPRKAVPAPTSELRAAEARPKKPSRDVVVELESTTEVKAFADEFVQDLPVPRRFYANNPTLPESAVGDDRARNFRARVRGVSNVDPLTGRHTGKTATEDVKIVSSGAAVSIDASQVAALASLGYLAGGVETPGFNTESYAHVEETGFVTAADEPLSTFSIDVDTASYANIRRFLNQGQLPPQGAVRIEEMLNYFDYDYPEPTGTDPFSITVDVADCPWNPDHRLARIGLKGREPGRGEFAGSNLVFLIDVSGSMSAPNKLGLLKSALTTLAEQLDGRDQVAIVTYAGASGVLLESTAGSDPAIKASIARLGAGGGTNGAAGIRAAYAIARENFIPGGVNRVILATDGDFNLGVTSTSELLDIIRADADNGVFLTTLGVGTGNYKDDTLETLADKGNGNHHYLDSLREARKVLVDDLAGTLFTIAKDVKIQVEFNPAEVGAYRLIGYDNRRLANQDFNDDKKDAGEIGAGHTVTALYEIVPPGRAADIAPQVDPLRYRQPTAHSDAAASGEMMNVKIRYKAPEGRTSRLLSQPVRDRGLKMVAAPSDFRFAAAVAEFGLVLRDSEHRADADLGRLVERNTDLATIETRDEFFDLVRRAIAADAGRSIQ